MRVRGGAAVSAITHARLRARRRPHSTAHPADLGFGAPAPAPVVLPPLQRTVIFRLPLPSFPSSLRQSAEVVSAVNDVKIKSAPRKR